MNIQEQREAIREGLVRFCECECMGDSEECPNCEFGLAFADRILVFLTEQGAVLHHELTSRYVTCICYPLIEEK